eukprot:INCI10398.1.p1 GENE.INCI10398.1~~INCI10398.1.p1  ORF type:complete len:225 (-),score=47.14 INCI10398.1:346-1020(-)
MSSLGATFFGVAVAAALARRALLPSRKQQLRKDDLVHTLLFDMDGVLANVSESYRMAIVRTGQRFNAEISFEDISKAKAAGNANNDWKLSHRLILQKLQEKQLAEEEMPSYEQVRDVFEEIYQGGLWKTEDLIIDPSLLQRLHDGGVRMAIVTGRPRDPDCTRFLRHYGIAHFFDAVVCMEDCPPKPSPEPLQIALRGLGVDAGPNVLMIGDTVDDIKAAISAG